MIDSERRIAALEAQVRHLQDHVDICQVIARYGPLADSADSFDHALHAGALWSDDGVYDLGGDWQGTGRAGVAALLDNDVHRALVDDGAAHIPSMPCVRVDGDRASAVNYTRVYKHVDGTFIVWRVSVNHWQLEREASGWKISRRTNRQLDGNEEARALLRLVRQGD